MLARTRWAALVAAATLSCACVSPGGRVQPRTAEARAGTTASPEPDEPAGDGATAAPQGRSPSEAGGEGDGDDENDDEEAADDVEVELPPDATVVPPHPLDGVSAAEIDRRVAGDLASLGPMSVGKPNAGRLVNGVAMPEDPKWHLVSPGTAWGTEETVRSLATAISAVWSAFPNTPELPIGDISARSGGYLAPHLSHQAGRDVDIGYYYVDGERWYRRANEKNLDLPRTWSFVKALITLTDVEMLLIDHSIQKLLRDYAAQKGEDPAWLELVFRGRGSLPALIRHAPGHATHLHIRFYSPLAQETGRRAFAALVHHGKIPVGSTYVTHVVKKGETLAKLAKRYGTTVRAIRRANGLRSSVVFVHKSYRIPTAYHAPPAVQAARVGIPPRRLPPEKPAAAPAELSAATQTPR